MLDGFQPRSHNSVAMHCLSGFRIAVIIPTSTNLLTIQTLSDHSLERPNNSNRNEKQTRMIWASLLLNIVLLNGRFSENQTQTPIERYWSSKNVSVVSGQWFAALESRWDWPTWVYDNSQVGRKWNHTNSFGSQSRTVGSRQGLFLCKAMSQQRLLGQQFTPDCERVVCGYSVILKL